jgi:hypothetical protein
MSHPQAAAHRGQAAHRAGTSAPTGWAGAGDPTGEVAAAWQGKELLCVPSVQRSACQQPASPWTSPTAGAMAFRSLSCPGSHRAAWEAEVLAFHATDGCSNGPPRPSTCSLRDQARRSRLAASATSPTTGCGCYCTAASGGRLTPSQDCEAAPHVWMRRAGLGGRRLSAGRGGCGGRRGRGARS